MIKYDSASKKEKLFPTNAVNKSEWVSEWVREKERERKRERERE